MDPDAVSDIPRNSTGRWQNCGLERLDVAPLSARGVPAWFSRLAFSKINKTNDLRVPSGRGRQVG